jgi:hypothetical protein
MSTRGIEATAALADWLRTQHPPQAASGEGSDGMVAQFETGDDYPDELRVVAIRCVQFHRAMTVYILASIRTFFSSD